MREGGGIGPSRPNFGRVKANRGATNAARCVRVPLIFTLHYDPLLYDVLTPLLIMSVVGIDFGALHSKVRPVFVPLHAPQGTDVFPLISRLVLSDTVVSSEPGHSC